EGGEGERDACGPRRRRPGPLPLAVHEAREPGRRDAERQRRGRAQDPAGGVDLGRGLEDVGVELDVLEGLPRPRQRHLAVGGAVRVVEGRPRCASLRDPPQIGDGESAGEAALPAVELGPSELQELEDFGGHGQPSLDHHLPETNLMHMDPLSLVLILAGVTCALCWIASLLTKDTSWVDRAWSVVPVVYVWVFALAAVIAGRPDARLLLMAGLVTAWGARLTFNFARKGGYTGMEDYRWAILRARMKPWQFQVFNVLFIVLFQNALLVLITL